jgi:hypothetical protein
MTTNRKLSGETLGGAGVERKLSLEEPLICPFCHKSIETNPLYFLEKNNSNFAEFFLRCKSCQSSFIGYAQIGSDGCFHISSLSKGKHKTKNFPSEIKEVSEKFVQIYGESEFAEQENLTEICGVGYRKALEFLIKDYLIKKFPEKEDEIKKKFLGNCISELIENSRIKEITKRATWLGNDETHYFKKWEDKDLEDLKKLIEITVHFISMEIEADKYMGEMGE